MIKKKISVVINARIKSSRLKNKLLRKFHNSNLLDIALKKLDKLSFFDHRYLATAEKEIKNKSKKYKNIKILTRNNNSVAKGPHHPLITFEHYLRIPTDYIFVINPCAAHLKVKTIKKAYDFFQKTSYKSYIASTLTRDWIFSHDGTALTHKDNSIYQNTSDNKPSIKVTHSFYIIKKNNFLKNKGKCWSLKRNDPYLYIIPKEETFDVDDIYDFYLSEKIYKEKNKK